MKGVYLGRENALSLHTGKVLAICTRIGTIIIASHIFFLNYHRLVYEAQICMISSFCHNLLEN